jgi:hypothetical protein
MKTLEQLAAAAAKEHVALMAILAAEAVQPLSFPSEERAAVIAAAIPIVDREFRRNLAREARRAARRAAGIPVSRVAAAIPAGPLLVASSRSP